MLRNIFMQHSVQQAQTYLPNATTKCPESSFFADGSVRFNSQYSRFHRVQQMNQEERDQLALSYLQGLDGFKRGQVLTFLQHSERAAIERGHQKQQQLQQQQQQQQRSTLHASPNPFTEPSITPKPISRKKKKVAVISEDLEILTDDFDTATSTTDAKKSDKKKKKKKKKHSSKHEDSAKKSRKTKSKYKEDTMTPARIGKSDSDLDTASAKKTSKRDKTPAKTAKQEEQKKTSSKKKSKEEKSTDKTPRISRKSKKENALASDENQNSQSGAGRPSTFSGLPQPPTPMPSKEDAFSAVGVPAQSAAAVLHSQEISERKSKKDDGSFKVPQAKQNRKRKREDTTTKEVKKQKPNPTAGLSVDSLLISPGKPIPTPDGKPAKPIREAKSSKPSRFAIKDQLRLRKMLELSLKKHPDSNTDEVVHSVVDRYVAFAAPRTFNMSELVMYARKVAMQKKRR